MMAASSSASAAGGGGGDDDGPEGARIPTVVLCIGMAGSGKSTWMARMVQHAKAQGKTAYVINLDPAVMATGYKSNVDIRDTVAYKEVMKTYQLGPNGGIVTSLNLFATRFDQVVDLVEKRVLAAAAAADDDETDGGGGGGGGEAEAGGEAKKKKKKKKKPLDYVFVDTPGQIEVFTWSASGTVISEGLANSFPTVLCFLADTPRCTGPQTFMSNMLQACSMLYRFAGLPLVLCFNKIDVARHEFAEEWMADFEAFFESLDSESAPTRASTTGSYSVSLCRSLALALEPFYKTIRAVGVSAVTGEGCDAFFAHLETARDAYYRDYYPGVLERREKREAEAEARKSANASKFDADHQTQTSAGQPL
ncbi:GPN-loop GTPase [Pseudoscourfieldia marina]